MRERATARFSIRIPRKRVRRGRFVSPSTKALSITIDPGSARQITLDANLTPGSPGCSNGVCTIVVNPPVGRHLFDVRTYDEPLANGVPQGNVLSQTMDVPFVVRRGKDNRIGVVLEGVPVSLVVSADPGEDVSGDQVAGFVWYGAFSADGSRAYPRTFTVAPLDADGNLIAGPGRPRSPYELVDECVRQRRRRAVHDRPLRRRDVGAVDVPHVDHDDGDGNAAARCQCSPGVGNVLDAGGGAERARPFRDRSIERAKRTRPDLGVRRERATRRGGSE